MAPKVSVVIPNYNYAQFLGPAMASVLRQSMGDLELIVIDNFSSDHSETVVLGARDPRVSFHKHANHGVIASARNLGMNLARGEFIAFLDSDDRWSLSKLGLQLQAMEGGAFASYHDLRAIKHGIPRRVKGFDLGSQPLQEMLIGGNPIPLSSVMCRRDLLVSLGGFPDEENLVGVEDFGLWLKAADKGLDFKYMPRTLGYYRVHKSSSNTLNSASRTQKLVAQYKASLTQGQARMSGGFVAYAMATQARSAKDANTELRLLIECVRSKNRKFVWRALTRILGRILRPGGLRRIAKVKR